MGKLSYDDCDGVTTLELKTSSKVVIAVIALLSSLLGGAAANLAGKSLSVESQAKAQAPTLYDSNREEHSDIRRQIERLENSVNLTNAKLDLLIQGYKR